MTTAAPSIRPSTVLVDKEGHPTREMFVLLSYLRQAATNLSSLVVEDQIVNGVTDMAPSENAVFDALALKADVLSLADYLTVVEASGHYQPLAEVLSALSALGNAPGVLANDGTGVLSWMGFGRVRLTADTTYHCVDYPGTGGVGGDTGTGTADDPFVGPQYALDWIEKNIDTAGFGVTLSIDSDIATENARDGFIALFIGNEPVVGGGSLAITFAGGSKITCATSGTGIISNAFKVLSIENADFDGADDSVYFTHIIVDAGEVDLVNPKFGKAGNSDQCLIGFAAILTDSGSATIYGGGNSHATQLSQGSRGSFSNYTITGTPAFATAFVLGEQNASIVFAGTFTGGATGVRYIGRTGAAIVSTNTLPGDADGQLDQTSSYNLVFGLGAVPAGGTTSQVLAKTSDTDFDTEWVDASSGSGTVASVVPGSGIDVDATDPANPVVSVETNLQAWNALATSSKLDSSALDTDGTLAANSDSKVASQKATKTFVAASIAALSTVYQAISTALGQIAGLSPSNDDFLQRKAGAWANRTVAQVKTDLSLSGSNTGDQTTVSGNAGTATALQTGRNIDGQAFDGTAAITVIAPGTHAATSKATPVDADELPIVDSAASNVLKKLTWANLKATLKTYLDTLYQPLASALTSWASVSRASGFDTFAATPTSANLAALLTDESGTGAAVFAGSPALTGTPTAPTAAVDTNTTQLATTAMVLAQAAAATPLGNAATAAVGTSTRFARADHVHPGREVLTGARTYYVGANIPAPTITIASPAVVTSTAHGLSAGDPVVFNVPLNTTAATISAANPAVVTMANTFSAGRPVKFSSTGSLPYGIVPGTTYYVISTGLSGSQFEVSATVGGSAISTAAPTAGFTNGSANITITNANTYYSVGQTTRFATTGGLPTNFATATDYFVVSASSTLITVSATNGGSAIVAGSAGSGTQTALQSGSHFTSTTGALPTGLTEGTTYYVSSASLGANSFQVADTAAHGVAGTDSINTSGSVTGSPIYNAYTGNDTNTGLAQTRAGAFLTLQAAVNAAASVDLTTKNITIQAASGTYTSGVSVVGAWVGSGSVTLTGDTTSPSNVLISTTSANGVLVTAYGRLSLSGFKVQTKTSGLGIAAQNGGVLTIAGAMEYGACVAAQIYAERAGVIIITVSYTVSGAAASHVQVLTFGYVFNVTNTVTIIGNPAFTQFASPSRFGVAEFSANTFIGSVTGARYLIVSNGAVNTFGGGASYLPGNSAGTAISPGWYA